LAKVWKKLQRADGDFQGTWDGVQKSNVYHTSNKPSKSDVGLSNVTNESKATMFASPTFTGTPSGISKSHVGLGNVGNTSVADIRSGVTKADVGLGNVDNESKASILGGTFTGDIGGTSAADIKTKAIAGEAAKSAVDGSSAITMVGGSLSIGTPASGVYPFAVDTSGNLKIKNDEFQALADGTVNCKGNFTINQDSNGDSRIVLVGDSSGTAEVEVQGANPTFDLGGASPLGTSTLHLKRGSTSNQARIQFRTGSSGSEFSVGNSNNSGINTQYAIHHGPLWSSGTAPERALSFDADGKMGMYSNSKTVSGFTFGSDGTNKHVYIKNGGLGIGTTSITDNDLNVQGTSIFNGNVTLNSDIDVSGSCTFQGETQFDDATNGLSYSDLSNKPTIPNLTYGTSVSTGAGYIWIMPSQFMPNDDNSYYNAAMVDNGAQARVMSTSLELYANIPIPANYKVTHARLNGTASVQISMYYSDITTATATSAQVTTMYTNTNNAVNPSSGIAADTTNGRYMILKWSPTSTAHRLYGAYLKLAAI